MGMYVPGGGGGGGGALPAYVSITASVTLTATTNTLYGVNITTNFQTITLPPASTCAAGVTLQFKSLGVANGFSVAPQGTDMIEGVNGVHSVPNLQGWDYFALISNGTNLWMCTFYRDVLANATGQMHFSEWYANSLIVSDRWTSYSGPGGLTTVNGPVEVTNVGLQVDGGGIHLNASSSGSSLISGSGVPAAGTGNNGDYYLRSDTPATANQRLYVKSAGAWVAIL